MIADKQVVEADLAFRLKVSAACKEYGKKSRASQEIGINRQVLYRFLNTGFVRMEALKKIVERVEGLSANPVDYVKPVI